MQGVDEREQFYAVLWCFDDIHAAPGVNLVANDGDAGWILFKHLNTRICNGKLCGGYCRSVALTCSLMSWDAVEFRHLDLANLSAF